MDKNKYEIIRLRMERTAGALRKNNMYCVCADTSAELPDIISDLLSPSDTVSVGGSMTLFETGIIDLLRNGPYNFLDRYVPGLSPEQIQNIYTNTFSADAFLSSTNAITENGELYNVDGNGNRVAAMIYGPKSVIIIAGYNKIVKDLDEAKTRVEEFAAPSNARRLNTGTPCTVCGKCMNCSNENRICADTVILGRQRIKDRIKVILVGEELGY